MRFRPVRAPLAATAALLMVACLSLDGLTLCFGENGHVAVESPATSGSVSGGGTSTPETCGCADACGPCRDAAFGPGNLDGRPVRPIDPSAFGFDVLTPLPFALSTATPPPLCDAGTLAAWVSAEPRPPDRQRASILLI